MSKITTHELAKYAVDRLEAGADSVDVARSLASLLLDERRSRELPQVMRAIDKELSVRGSTQVVVTAAHETTDETKKQLATLLEAKDPVFTEVIDLSVIGGVKARSGETEIDLTVRGKLNAFRRAVTESSK